ncbi:MULTISPECIES: glycosyltransferase [unclassified Brevundimonas]|uniref:glycosyltransferase n=1 Tax=unclassified Brevundimonas TaxID=2622653 RepID=UPI0025C233D6|nr:MULTISPECIES: glycosyltransferase [unclassified Brevundimonas]
MSRAPRVLLVSPTYTHPQDQGNSARIHAFARQLKRRGIEVDLLYFVLAGLTDDGLYQMQQEWNAVHLLDKLPHRQQSFASHWGLDDWCPDALVSRVRALTAQNRYSAVIVNYVWLSGCFEAVHDSLRILDTHDLFGDRARLAIDAGLEPSWFFTTVEEERRGLDRADLVLAIQDEEERILAARTKARVQIAGHLIDAIPAIERPYTDNPVFGYFGSANPWNIASARALDRALVAPQSTARWAVAGSVCQNVGTLQSHPITLGRVNHPSDFYDMVDCVLNPMTAGTGLKIKTIEALAYGRPVMGTDQAFVGLPARHEAHVLADPDAMVQAMAAYSQNSRYRDELAVASREVWREYTSVTETQYDALANAIRANS